MKKMTLTIGALILAAGAQAHGMHPPVSNGAHGMAHAWPALIIGAAVMALYLWKRE